MVTILKTRHYIRSYFFNFSNVSRPTDFKNNNNKKKSNILKSIMYKFYYFKIKDRTVAILMSF